MPRSDLNGVSLHWEETGPANGALLIMVHGSWSDLGEFRHLASAMSGRFRVITYDRRGHSGSSGPADNGTAEDDVGDLAALIQAQRDGRACVFGHSFGGMIALKLAIARPDLVARLAVHEPPLAGHLDPEGAVFGPVREVIGRVLELLMAHKNEEAAKTFFNGVSQGPDAWEKLPEAARRAAVQTAQTFRGEVQDPHGLQLELDRLAAFEGPILLTRGTASPLFFGASADLLGQALPSIRQATIEGAGHVPHVTHEAMFAALLSDFFQGG